MKNIQIATFSRRYEGLIFAVTTEDFKSIFPDPDQDIEFIEDVYDRLGEATADALFERMYDHEVNKPDVIGIHGTLFKHHVRAKQYYPTKKRAEMIRTPLDVRPG